MNRWIDKINNPETAVLNRRDKMAEESHYQQMEIQPWDVMEDLLTPEEFIGYLKGNMIKYAMRQGKKEDSDDAGKLQHYMVKLNEFQALVQSRKTWA